MSNILDKKCQAMAPTPNASPVPKREKYAWAKPGPPGRYMMINKADLNIDGTYQRDMVSEYKVMTIASEWSWLMFGTLLVIRRKDGTYWVYDGGHRTRSAFYRDDITELPCMVFEVDDLKAEAAAFHGSNVFVSNVSAYDKHRALWIMGDPIALAARAILEKHGYSLAKAVSKKFDFAAINTLQALVKEDRVLAEKVFAACAGIAQDGEPVSGEVLKAIFTCQKKLEGKADILANGHLERMKRETLPGLEAAMRREKHIIGKGGATICAKAILDVLNKGKQRRLTFAQGLVA